MGGYRTLVVMPAYNEEVSIGKTVAALAFPVLVVDDASIDSTASEAELAGALVFSHERNLGYDAALTSGLQMGMALGYDFLITFDADGQHSSVDALEVAKLLRLGFPLVVGSRQKLPRISERLYSKLISHKFGIKDPMCGLKGYSVKHLRRAPINALYGTIGSGYALWIAASFGRVANLDIVASPRTEGASRFGGSFRANIRILASLVRQFRIIAGTPRKEVV